MPRVGRLATLSFSLLLVAACSSATVSPAAQASRTLAGRPLTPCQIAGDLPVKASIAGLCGTLDVPEDRSNPGRRTIGLRVAVVPALAAVPAPDPLFVIAGGPGDAGTQFFAWLPAHYAGVHATHDIVLVDQRGTGASNALELPQPPDTSGLSDSNADLRLSTWMRDSLTALAGDPRFYTSTVAADDVEAIRAALGYERIDLYGVSYGGTLVQYYLRQHPDRVRVAVLDGSTPIDVPVLERMAVNSQHALDLLFERCATDPACHAAFPDLDHEWSALVRDLAAGVTTSVVNPDTGEPWVADLEGVGPSLHLALRTGPTAAQVPLAIHLASLARWEEAAALVPAPASGGDILVMAQEILCSEAWARFDEAEVERIGVGSYALPKVLADARGRATVCRYLPQGVVPIDDAAPVRTLVPTLWLTGDGDPQDPPANLTGVSDQQPNSLIVVMPAQEHVVGHLGCLPGVISAFVDAGTADGLDTSCVAAGAAPTPTFRLR